MLTPTPPPVQARTPRFVPAHSSLGDLLPHDDVLTPAELEQLARALALRPDLWEPLVRVDRSQRR